MPSRFAIAASHVVGRLRQLAVAAAQVVLLWLVSQVGHGLVAVFHFPLPGNAAGLLLMFLALWSGAVPVSFVERGGTLLLRHLSLLFIPLAVGLQSFGDLLVSHGLAIVAVLFGSAAIGFVVTGRVSQALIRWSRRNHGKLPKRHATRFLDHL